MNFDFFWQPIDIIGCNILGKRFIGAQNVDDVLRVGQGLKSQGYSVTYNLLGEHVTSEVNISLAFTTTEKLIGKMNADNSGNVSCKPTLYGLCLSKNKFRDILGKLVNSAHDRGIEIEIDAENYSYISDTFDVFSYFASRPDLRNNIRQAVQAHLANIESLMDKYSLWDKNLRIVKGSGVYNDDKLIAQRNNFIVSERYGEILRRNLRSGRSPFTATVRDRELALEAVNLADSMGGSVTVQTLYGPLSSGFRNKLLKAGRSVNVYIPFTDYWCRDAWRPYGLRRAQMMRRIIWMEIKSLLDT